MGDKRGEFFVPRGICIYYADGTAGRFGCYWLLVRLGRIWLGEAVLRRDDAVALYVGMQWELFVVDLSADGLF